MLTRPRGRVLEAVFVLACAVACLPDLSLAQPAAPAPPPRREGSADFAFVSTTGNGPTQTIGFGAEILLRPEVWTLRAKTAFIQNETDDVVNTRSFAALVRAARLMRLHLSFYGQYDYLRNAFAGILHRNALDMGVSWQAIEPARHALRFDAGVGYARERRAIGADEANAVLSLGVAYTLKVSATAEFIEEARTMLSLADADDWRGENIVSLSAKLNTLLSLKVSNTLRYVNRPTSGFEAADTTTAVALVAKF